MASRTTTFWTFIVILVLLHLTLRVGAALTWVPDLLVVAALLGARRLNGAGAAFLGLVLGILADSLAVISFGATAVALVIVCYLGSRSRNLFEGESVLFTLIYVFAGAFLVEAIRFAVGGGLQRGETFALVLRDTPLLAALTAAAAFVSLLAYRAVTGNR